MVTLNSSQGRLALSLTAVAMGNDLCVTITGGDTPHLGALALAQARPSLENPEQLSATTSVITLMGHKEDVPAKAAAEFLSVRLNKNVVVCCGIHLDNITQNEILLTEAMIDHLLLDYVELSQT